MICPVCKSRWAPTCDCQCFSTKVVRLVEDERKVIFENSELKCCGDPDCLEVVDAMLAQNAEFGTGATYNDLVEETQKELAEGKIK